MRRRFRPHWTVRLRLTLVYGGLFFIAGAVLLTLMYVLLSRSLEPPRPPEGEHGPPPVEQQAADGTDTRTVEQQIQDARREERQAALRQVKIEAGIALVVTSVGALGLGWVVGGRVLRPIRDITAHAREASEANLDERIDLAGPEDELKELADTIDEMLERLRAAFDSQRRFAAQASHELRTPLAIMRAEADVALSAPDATERERTTARAIRTAAERSERLVAGLLVLARSESTMRDDDPVDLANLAGDVVGEYLRVADAAHIRVDLELDAARTTGDPVLLGQLIGNLVENGIRYNVSDGMLRVTVTCEPPWAVLRVRNSGRVIDEQELAALFRPFQRGLDQQSRKAGGFGLGLAVVRSVVEAHHGEIDATPLPEGGLEVAVRLPLWREGDGHR